MTPPAGVRQFGDWYFASRLVRDGQEWIAWCAKTTDLGEGPLSVPFDLDCYFEFGATEEDAISKLKREVLH